MFGLFRRRPVVRPHGSFGLHVERLDDRIVPAAPSIASLGGRIIGSNIIVYGTVQDDGSGVDTVAASGGISGTQAANSSGFFEFIAPYTGNGSVTIVVTDDEGLQSSPTGVALVPSPLNQTPYISFMVSYGAQKSVTFTGVVYDENPAGLYVSIYGAATASNVQTDSAGHFSVTVTANSLGEVNAKTWDSQGVQSNIATLTLTTLTPIISNVTCEPIGYHTYKIRGYVADESAQGMVITFGGEAGTINPATVGADGWFETTFTYDGNASVWITLDTTDCWGVAATQKRYFLVV